MAELPNKNGKGMRVSESFTLCYVILTIKPVNRGYYYTKTRNISLSLRRTHLFAIAASCLQRASTTTRGSDLCSDLQCHIPHL